MKLILTDVLILLLALLAAVIVTFLEFKYSSDVDVACFCPAHFETSHIEFVTSACAGFWSTGDVYDMPEYRLPKSREPKNRNEQSDWNQRQNESSLNKLLVGQTVVAIVTFMLLHMVIALLATRARALQLSDDQTPDVAEDDNKIFHHERKGDSINRKKKVLKQMSRSRSLTIVYCVILLVAALSWLILAAKSHGVLSYRRGETQTVKCNNCTNDKDNDLEGSTGADIFMCDVKVRVLGNVQRYTLQCVAATETPGNRGVFAAALNTAMCFTIACLLLIHLLYTLVVAPMINCGMSGIGSDVHLYIAVST